MKSSRNNVTLGSNLQLVDDAPEQLRVSFAQRLPTASQTIWMAATLVLESAP